MTVRTLIGDCRTILPTLPPNSVHCVVTSPPYYGLRDYGTARWEGGDAACGHVAPPNGGRGKSTMNSGEWQERWIAKLDQTTQYRATCGRCGARRIDAQLGLEPTPEAYLQTMVEVFREVRRVLRDDGTCWVNMGDSYAGTTEVNGKSHNANAGALGNRAANGERKQGIRGGAKPKDLLMMPARLALALQADGWWLRSDIIWHKPNPMPESVTDRPTSAHEHVFLLTKRSRYYFDADAVREPHARLWDDTNGGSWAHASRIDDPVKGRAGTHRGDGYPLPNPAGRSCRNVWTIATHAYSDAHFATFPPALVERCIRAGTSERGCCAVCGKPWGRITETTYTPGGPKHSGNAKALRFIDGNERQDSGYKTRHDTTTGWAAGCGCEAGERPCVVLDPFGGAGTTGLVADRLQRDAVMIELNPQYVGMADARIVDDCPLFSSWPPADDPADERMADLFAPLAAD